MTTPTMTFPPRQIRLISLRTLRWPTVVLVVTLILAAWSKNAGWFGPGGAVIAAIGSWLWARRVFRLQDPDAPPPSLTGPPQGPRGAVPLLGEGFRELQQRGIDNIVGRMGVRIAIAGGLIASLPFFLGLAHVWTPGTESLTLSLPMIPHLPSEFWWNWWVQVAVAVGTLLAAGVALFVAIAGHRLRHWLFPPVLTLSIDKVEGVPAVTVRPGGPPARWYHVVVRNQARWSNAHNVRVFLLQVETPGPDGALQLEWTGEQQLIWENQELYPLARTVGPDAKADLIAIYENRVLELRTVIIPFSLRKVREGACDLTLTLQARADEGDSPALRVRVSWDGRWNPGEQEMRQHLVLRRV